MRPLLHAVFVAGLILARLPMSRLAAAEDPFAADVRATDPLAPVEQQKKFKLPPGFEIQIVATEPDINKPMNMAFDAKGRLWVTTSIEYPWPAPTNRVGKDRLMIFEDFAPDGRARKVTEFAGGLNIPIGIYPFYSARTAPKASPAEPDLTWKAIVWSIPHLWLLEDTDGDGKADKRTPLYGPFDHTRDTHGNQSSFRRGFDGWLYATHGFNNDSHVTAPDGSHVDLNSGNTYRVRLDGSRIEQHTHGQVNPFGLAWDPSGNLYSSDCHSAPVYQLLAGGWYPSFGKPHDGLGFAPVLMEHAHGSTAIDGMVYYADNLWPDEYRDNTFIGNVMTSRLNRDKMVFHGSTPRAIEQDDFVKSEDPWFRPVDNQLGPDGALYIADFYNRIIGHYEVPLTHPGRDRERGRIWRVVYKGANGGSAASAETIPAGSDAQPATATPVANAISPKERTEKGGNPSTASRSVSASVASVVQPKGAVENGVHVRTLDLTTGTTEQLVAELADPNLTWRMLAMNQIEDRIGKPATSALQDAVRKPVNSFQHLHALWLLHRLNPAARETDPASKALAVAAKSNDPLVRVHAERIAVDMLYQNGRPGVPGHADIAVTAHAVAMDGLKDPDALVQRCAAEALGDSNSAGPIRPLLDLLERVPAEDTHLRYVVRKSIRDKLTHDEAFSDIAGEKWSDADLRALADVAVAVKSEHAGSFLNRQLARLDFDRASLTPVLQHIARYAPVGELDSLGAFVKSKFANDLDFQLALFNSVATGAEQRGASLSDGLRGWGADLCQSALASNADGGWTNFPIEAAPTANPWGFEERPCADGQKTRLLSSLPRGESLTGALRSREFTLPATLSFYLSGHDGFPDKPAAKKNGVRLWLAPEHGSQSASANSANATLLAEAYPPRNDTAQKITWNLSAHAGKRAFLEVTDGDTGGAFAWLAFGRFEPSVLALPAAAPAEFARRQQTAADVAARLRLASLSGPLDTLARDRQADSDARSAAARASLALNGAAAIPSLAALLNDASEPAAFRTRLGELLGEQKSPDAHAAVTAAMKSVPYRTQLRWATALTGNRDGADAFLRAAEQGLASPRILQSTGAKNRLQAANPPDWEARLRKLTANLPPADEARDKLIAERRTAFGASAGKAADGQRVFQQACAVCHQIGGQGALVGPQLDGIGNRGLERILEDVLDPNRNVDSAFRSYMIILKDADIITGLPRREEGELLVIADSTGKEISIPKKTIATRRESDVSLMPENFGEALSAEDFNHLMAYLLSQRGGQKK
jgi:putative heme-binding domain-containing protein